MKIPFNRPLVSEKEVEYVRLAMSSGHLSGDGPFTDAAQKLLGKITGSPRALLTHSCTGALEMAALLAGVGPGDEVIMPSYTFVSTANAFVLRGATPVFVDVREDSLNLDETQVEAAITPQTKAIVCVHYAGVGCEMDALVEISKRQQLFLIEDAAQALGAFYKGKPLGTFGQASAISFHETKNIISGEGGALLLNDSTLVERAEILRQKGTNRQRFLLGEVDKYTWVDLGSSFLPGELTAAFLLAQLEQVEKITQVRRQIWQRYHAEFEPFERQGKFRRPRIPPGCEHNAHLYHLLIPAERRDAFIQNLKKEEIYSVFHYIPLHSSPAGRKFGRTSGSLEVTDRLSAEVVRLPLWVGLEAHQDKVIRAVQNQFR